MSGGPVTDGRTRRTGTAFGARLRALGLVAGLGALGLAFGWVFAGWFGLVVALGVTASIYLAARDYGGRMVLRTFGARRLEVWQAPGLYEATRHLARRAGVRTPTLWLSRRAGHNAMAILQRDDRPALVLGRDLLRSLDHRQTLGVLAHELSHIAHRDTAISTAAAMMQTTIGGLAFGARVLGIVLMLVGLATLGKAPAFVYGLVLIVLGAGAPVLAALLQSAAIRASEFAADARAAELTGDPAGLASALVALERINRRRGAMAAFLGLGSPRRTPDWLATHPSTRDRVERLLAEELDRPGQALR